MFFHPGLFKDFYTCHLKFRHNKLKNTLTKMLHTLLDIIEMPNVLLIYLFLVSIMTIWNRFWWDFKTFPKYCENSHISVRNLLRWSLNWTHWLGVPGGERVGRLWVSNLSSDRLFLLTDSQSVPPNNFLASGLLGDLQTQRCEFSGYLKCWRIYA